MNKGDIVTVQDFRGRPMLRVVWEHFGGSIVVCSAGEFQNWKETGFEPKLAGFPYEEIRPLPEE